MSPFLAAAHGVTAAPPACRPRLAPRSAAARVITTWLLTGRLDGAQDFPQESACAAALMPGLSSTAAHSKADLAR